MDAGYCDHCDTPVWPDVNGWWVGEDDTSECRVSDRGHEVNGSARA